MQLKGTLPYDELYRIPCILKLPEGKTSKRKCIDDLISSQSFAATLFELADIDVPSTFSGRSFANVFDHSSHPKDESVFFEHYGAYWGIHPFYGVRSRDMKYVRYYGDDDTEELYDLSIDPHELCNQADNPSYRQQKDELMKLADHWWTRTGGRDAKYYESDEFKSL